MPWATTPNGDLLVGLLLEKRLNMGGDVLCVIGGFVKPDESHQKAAEREEEEEASIQSNDGPLAGVPINSNRLYFQANPQKDEGVHSYHVQVPFTDLTPANKHPNWYTHSRWQPKNGAELVFMPIEEAAQICPDALAYPAMLRIALEQREKSRNVLAQH